MSPSITFWNRLEPRPQARSIVRSLAAEIRDPLWMLTRQWQLGEFHGEDAASPAWIELTTRSSIDATWRRSAESPGSALISSPSLEPDVPVSPLAPIERALEEELPDGDDLSLALELGQTFEEMLHERLGGSPPATLVARLRVVFPLAAPSPSPRFDDDASRFVLIAGGRGIHGVDLYKAVLTDTFWTTVGSLEPTVNVPRVHDALNDFTQYVRELHGDFAGGEPAAWRPDGLRYEAEVSAATPIRTGVQFRAHPGRDGELDWYAFDAVTEATGFRSSPPRRLIPTHVRFRGMPNARWWDFESWRSDFGDIQTERRDLGRLAVMEFMLVQGNDWFMIPFDMHVGTVCQVESLRVRDVFDEFTPIQRADSLVPGWSMFSTTQLGPDELPRGYGDFFHLPASASLTTQFGATIEEVRFFRDEMANLAWALEHTVPNIIGEPISYRARADQARRERGAMRTATTPPAAATGAELPPMRYVLQTDVPSYWYPLVPTPADRSGSGQIVLRLGSFVASTQAVTLPDGRVLNASRRGPPEAVGGVRLDEGEVPRTGVRVVRRRCASRWIDGTLHVWTQRLRSVGTGEGSSGLRFDALEARR
jgi:hypothetical protein